MRIKTALSLSFVSIALIVAILTLALERLTVQLEQGAKEISHTEESIRIAEELKGNILLFDRDGSPVHAKATGKLLEEAKGYISGPEEATLLPNIKSAIGRYFEISSKGAQARQESLNYAVGLINRFIEINLSQAKQSQANIDSENKIAIKIGILLISTVVAILLFLFAGVHSLIYRPVVNLIGTLSEYDAGKTTLRAEAQGLRETKDLALSFNQMANRLDERREDQLRFIASMAHDIRNPLNSMSMAAQLLLEKDNGANRQIVDVLYRQVNNLDRLVGDLLDTTRIEAGKLELRPERQEVVSLLQETAELYKNSSHMHRVKLEVPSAEVYCMFDRVRISQVLNNLISNAIKYSPNGGLILLKAETTPENLKIAVKDEGIGIASEELQNVFRPFNRSKATRDTIPGIGLGLAASRKIVDAHGGSLSVESTLGSGSIFLVELPLH